MSELTIAIAYIKDKEKASKREIIDVIEEIADVEILLEQIKYLAIKNDWQNFSKNLSKCKQYKIQRTIDRYDIKK